MQTKFGEIIAINENWYKCVPNTSGNSFKYLPQRNAESSHISSRVPPKEFLMYRKPLILNLDNTINSFENVCEIAKKLEGKIIHANSTHDLLNLEDYNKLMFLYLMLKAEDNKFTSNSKHLNLALPRGYLLDNNEVKVHDNSYLPFWEIDAEDSLNKNLSIETDNRLIFTFKNAISTSLGYSKWDEKNKKTLPKVSVFAFDYLLIKE